MTKFELMRVNIVVAFAAMLRVPVRIREHFLMGLGYVDPTPRGGEDATQS